MSAQAKCNSIDDKDKCNARSSCLFIDFGVLEEDCTIVMTQPPEDPGCCYGNPDIAYSKRWMESCKEFGFESECLMLTNDDGEPRCTFEPLGEYEDCETVWPTTTTTTTTLPPLGCCRGSSYKAQAKCFGLEDEKACVRKDCEWLLTEDPTDCVITTTSTTSEPWLGAQAEAKVSSRRKGRRQESMLFGGESTVSQAMDTQVSLSTVLLLAIAAFAVYQTYRWLAGRQGDKMVAPLQTQSAQYYQSA
jgi:hypothetical protein